MLKLNLPFHLTECANGSFLRNSLAEFRRPGTKEIILEGLTISIDTSGQTYNVFSDTCPQPDALGPFCGTMWPRCLLPLPDAVSIEQQMLLPAGGDAIAISWRLIGPTLPSTRLRVSPLFLADRPFSAVGFEIEPETNGGRLAWRPYHHSSQIIADTNGRFVERITPTQRGIVPVSFEFDLGPHPAVLIFSSEPRVEAGMDPLIGGFLAQLTEQRTAMTDYNYQRKLVAA